MDEQTMHDFSELMERVGLWAGEEEIRIIEHAFRNHMFASLGEFMYLLMQRNLAEMADERGVPLPREYARPMDMAS